MNELIILRAIACLSVVLLHTIKVIVEANNKGEIFFEELLLTLAGFLSFGTPAFVFISIILFAYKYSDGVPKNFYSKRIKAILLPFISMAIFYGFVQTYNNISAFPEVLFYNLIGNFHGWFVLLIFQFYLLFHLFSNIDKKLSSYWVLGSSLLINIVYLGYFNFTVAPIDSKFINFVWNQGHWVPFLGWFFYFTFAYYSGKNYEIFLDKVHKHRNYILIALFASTIIVLINNYLNLFQYGSKRIDMIPFTVGIVTLILYIGSKVKKINIFINMISKYSFGIYLLHMFYLMIFLKTFEILKIHPAYWTIVLWFIGAILASIFTINIGNRIPLGKYVVGGINDVTKKLKNKVDKEHKSKTISSTDAI